MKYDIVSFGDITIDCFIKLIEARVNCDINDRNCMLCMRFGQKIPFESATEVLAVGNGPNAAVSASRLGLKSALVGHVGADKNGSACLEALKKEGVATEYVRTHENIKTNYHYVLQYEAERTILIKHEKYPYELPVFGEAPRWFYLTSLPAHALDYQLAIAKYAQSNGVKLAFQPGTFQIAAGKDALASVYKAADIFFCNKEEAQKILATDENDIKKLLAGARALGPKIAVITDGRNGAFMMDDSGCWSSPMYPDPAPPQNRTGAGDAAASTMIAYIAMGFEPKDALQRGLINSASVVQHIGAQAGLLTKDELEQWFAKRPADFQVKSF
ncbi:hypothetical protein A3F27_03590 [Candidatus Kaiserbacteria bacterium RIFCSPHIGHO2_12_FULL_53_13]|uniref:Carbohydrate kinase PfkB domain-containing protein n=1 Tax=Candidatus Kaiserbacteria bacterium RIFCSPHIGHO2_12_FULL_53_13 TaxID=1798502 RepID=A0A1F6EB69_9BACT|nr:MAG: hypothetical protein A3F27_03590 [Candidatus Kaiserbacteria bacterium RIFCSPHIGHO2_12_FULL_53_13]OGG74575.1 MAG: hypothetical protein A3A37_01235 [Candidatus Kaiserbacteria bacterium RIFCSPLOWO2_01_FULL_52_36]